MCELPRFLRAYFARRCGTTHLNVLFERPLAAAERLGDPLQLAEAHSHVGFARYDAGRTAEAATAYEAAELRLSEAEDTQLEAELAMRRGYLGWDAGHVEEPLELFRLAGKLYEQAGSPAAMAHAAASEAWVMLQLGHRAEAARRAREVLVSRTPTPRGRPLRRPGSRSAWPSPTPSPTRRRSTCTTRRRRPATTGTCTTRRGA
ncbi:hypothetical protein O1M54_02425 [Streptomyces diastatochromogenes]|nr:hypothetical protein [Streptomyces diastatochromogenes]